MAEFKDRIKELRAKNNFSQQRLADLINVNKQTISQYERGVRFASKENLEALCDVFNVSVDYLLGRDNVSPLLLTTDEQTLVKSYRYLIESAQTRREQESVRRVLLYAVEIMKNLDAESRKDLVKRAEELQELTEFRKAKENKEE